MKIYPMPPSPIKLPPTVPIKSKRDLFKKKDNNGK